MAAAVSFKMKQFIFVIFPNYTSVIGYLAMWQVEANI
jgi:hypothetical protein